VIFKYKVTEDNVLILKKDGVIASAVYMPVSNFSFGAKDFLVSYVMGVATLKEYRGHALMRPLMNASLEKMYKDGVAFCTLIPAEDWLYKYYSSFGFFESFYLKRERIDVKDCTDIQCEIADGKDTDKMYEAYSKFYVNEDLALKKTVNDFKAVISDHTLGGGRIRIALKNGEIIGVCFVIGDTVKEIFAEDEDTKRALICDAAKICKKDYVNLISRPKKGTDEGIYRRGMIRIVRLFDVLEAYAKMHTEMHRKISVIDDIIPENSGCYEIKDGKCVKLSDKTENDVVSMDEAAGFVLDGRMCYMNLMLD